MSNSKFATKFDSNSNQQFLTQLLLSTAESSSLRDPHGISTGKTSLFPAGDTGTIPFESPALWPHPQLSQGRPRGWQRQDRSFRVKLSSCFWSRLRPRTGPAPVCRACVTLAAPVTAPGPGPGGQRTFA